MTAFIETSKFWKQYLADASPCYFPTLTESSRKHEGTKSRSQHAFELHDTGLSKTLFSFCAQNELQVDAVVKAAWALVLRSYIGSGRVCFGFLEAEDARLNSSICSLAVEETDVILDIVERVVKDQANSLQHVVSNLRSIAHKSELHCNTVVCSVNNKQANQSDSVVHSESSQVSSTICHYQSRKLKT
jgi:hypothetical protein